jgi:hypothetical protein
VEQEGERVDEIRKQPISSMALSRNNRVMLDYIFPLYQHRIRRHSSDFQSAFFLPHFSIEWIAQ